jgi:hypothetical protein
MRLLAWSAWVGLAVGVGAAVGQSVAVQLPENPLLPQSFGVWKSASPNAAGSYAVSLAGVNKDALEEDGPQRSAVANYQSAGGALHVEAVEFGDRTGAESAFSLVMQPGMKPGTEVGAKDAVGSGAVLFLAETSVVLVNGAAANDVRSLAPLAAMMPKVGGTKGTAPLLPSLLPDKGLVEGSVRYALGAASYQTEGGVLPAQSLGWDKSAEAVTAKYADKRGQETLTVLLYPTPAIAGSFARLVEQEAAGMGPGFGTAKVRREGELVMLANGTFSPDEAQKMIENIHMREVLSFDREVQPVFHAEVQKTFSLLQNILLLFGILGGAAVVLGFFLGFGRAAIRVIRGKPAAMEPEFLSLHLEPQNAAPKFERTDGAGGVGG